MKVWESAVLEQLTYKLETSRGPTSKDKFISVWYEFVVFVNNGCGLKKR